MNIAEAYERVNEVQQVAPVTLLTFEEAGQAVRKMYRHLTGKVFPYKIAETTGNRYTWLYNGEFRVNVARQWDGLIHSFSHWHYGRTSIGRPHSKGHARLERKLKKWAISHGWTTGSLRKVDVEPAKPSKAEALVKLIDRRRAQVARLTTKIKSLTTRLKTAKRSLARMERVVFSITP